MWHEHGITQKAKVAVYRAMVLTSLLYGSETWTCYHRYIKKLDQFHLHCLHRLLDICCEDSVTNQGVLRHGALPDIETLIMQSQLRWSGHVMRMEDNRLPKQLICFKLVRGTRKHGVQSNDAKTPSSNPINVCNIAVTGWEALAANCNAWRQCTV